MPINAAVRTPHLAVAHAVCIFHLPFSIHFPFKEPQKRRKSRRFLHF